MTKAGYIIESGNTSAKTDETMSADDNGYIIDMTFSSGSVADYEHYSSQSYSGESSYSNGNTTGSSKSSGSSYIHETTHNDTSAGGLAHEDSQKGVRTAYSSSWDLSHASSDATSFGVDTSTSISVTVETNHTQTYTGQRTESRLAHSSASSMTSNWQSHKADGEVDSGGASSRASSWDDAGNGEFINHWTDTYSNPDSTQTTESTDSSSFASSGAGSGSSSWSATVTPANPTPGSGTGFVWTPPDNHSPGGVSWGGSYDPTPKYEFHQISGWKDPLQGVLSTAVGDSSGSSGTGELNGGTTAVPGAGINIIAVAVNGQGGPGAGGNQAIFELESPTLAGITAFAWGIATGLWNVATGPVYAIANFDPFTFDPFELSKGLVDIIGLTVDTAFTYAGHPLNYHEISALGRSNQPSNPDFLENAARSIPFSVFVFGFVDYAKTGDGEQLQRSIGAEAVPIIVLGGAKPTWNFLKARRAFSAAKGAGAVAAEAATAAEEASATTGPLKNRMGNLEEAARQARTDPVYAFEKPDTIPSAPPNKAVIGKLKDLDTLRPGEYTLLKHLPNQGSPKLNWKQNSSVLRQEMNKGRPIRDASVGPNGELVDYPGSFLAAERNLFRNRGWNYDESTRLWSPPK